MLYSSVIFVNWMSAKKSYPARTLVFGQVFEVVEWAGFVRRISILLWGFMCIVHAINGLLEDLGNNIIHN